MQRRRKKNRENYKENYIFRPRLVKVHLETSLHNIGYYVEISVDVIQVS